MCGVMKIGKTIFKNGTRMCLLLLLLTREVYCVPVKANPWQEMALQDIEAIHMLLTENHPGSVDKYNPSFKNQLELGYQAAKNKIKQIKNYIDYRFIVANYVNGFKDGHLGVYFLLTEKNQLFPGFIVRYQDSKFMISESMAPKKIPNNAELLSCDGISIKTIMLKDVFPLHSRNPKLEASWYANTPYLLQDSLPSWEVPYKKCLIRFHEQDWTVELDYSKVSGTYLPEKINHLFGGVDTTFHVDYLNKNTAWVRLPKFYTKNDSELISLRKIIQTSSKLANYKYIVFDLRGNTGGDSSWGEELLSKIYGKNYIDTLVSSLNKNTFIEWRVSKHNLQYLEDSLLNYKKVHKSQSMNVQCFSDIVQDMKVSLKKDKQLMVEACDGNKACSFKKTEPISHAKPILLTDQFCSSACLDFLDISLKLPGGIQIGLPTSADTTYMDISQAPLPSSIATLSYAMKVYRHRLRGSNEPYLPSTRFSGNMADEQALKEWVLNQINSI